MGVGRIFSREALRDFFRGGGKSSEICFSHSKLRKQPFLLKLSKSRRVPTPMSLTYIQTIGLLQLKFLQKLDLESFYCLTQKFLGMLYMHIFVL